MDYPLAEIQGLLEALGAYYDPQCREFRVPEASLLYHTHGPGKAPVLMVTAGTSDVPSYGIGQFVVVGDVTD
jgi:hypothetical protein